MRLIFRDEFIATQDNILQKEYLSHIHLNVIAISYTYMRFLQVIVIMLIFELDLFLFVVGGSPSIELDGAVILGFTSAMQCFNIFQHNPYLDLIYALLKANEGHHQWR